MTYGYILDLIDAGLIRKGTALDLGCGPLPASILLAMLGFDVEAVDWASQDVPKLPEGGDLKFIKSDIRSFPVPEDTYDFIHARHVLHFISKEEIRATIQRMYKGLKKGGLMYFTLSGSKDGWRDKSKNVTFLTDEELVTYVEDELIKNGLIHNKTIKLGYGTTTSGIRKYSHTISYTVIRPRADNPTSSVPDPRR